MSQAALKAAKQTKDGRDEEVAALRAEIEVVYVYSGGTHTVVFILIIFC